MSLFRVSLQHRRTVWHVFFDRSLQCCNLIAAPHGLMLHSLLDLVVQAQNHMAQISFLFLDNTPQSQSTIVIPFFMCHVSFACLS